MNAVGIDVSKGKSTVTIHRPGDVVIMPPADIPHIVRNQWADPANQEP